MADPKLNVRIGADNKELKRRLKDSKKQIGGFEKTVRSAGQALVAAFAARAVWQGLKNITIAASDAQETFNKFDTIYRDVAKSAEESFQVMRNEYGLSSKAAKELLGNTGDLLTGFGFSGSAAIRLSEDVNKLAVDLASFTNFSGGAKGASEALTKALLGERESVKSLGISILEADVKKQVAINTAKGLIFETERQAKAQATLDIAIQQSQNAIGDYARTSDSFANKSRELKARTDDLSVSLGQLLLPEITKTTSKLVELAMSAVQVVNKFDAFLDKNKEIMAAVSSDKELNIFQKNWAAMNRWFGRTTKAAHEATYRMQRNNKIRINLLDDEIAAYIKAGLVESDVTQAKIRARNTLAETHEWELKWLDNITGKWQEVDDAVNDVNNTVGEQKLILGDIGRIEEEIGELKKRYIETNSAIERAAHISRMRDLEKEKERLNEIAETQATLAGAGNIGAPQAVKSIGPGGRDGKGVGQAPIDDSSVEMKDITDGVDASAQAFMNWEAVATDAAHNVALGLMAMAADGKFAVSELIKQTMSQVIASLIASIMTNVPFPANIALAMGAGVIGGRLMNQVPAFADGGMVKSPTMAMFGEYAGARTNPEYALRQDQLQSVIRQAGSNVSGEFKIRGQDLVATLNEAQRRGRVY